MPIRRVDCPSLAIRLSVPLISRSNPIMVNVSLLDSRPMANTAAALSLDCRCWSGVVGRATDELVHRLGGVQDLRRGLAAADGKCSIEEADLDEHRSLVPVQMLVRDLVALELHDDDEGQLHASSGRRDAGQEPVQADRVREACD